MKIKTLLAAAALLSTGMAQATCFSVYKADGTVLLETSITPVDLSQQLGDTVTAKFGPGATMTMSEHGVYCSDRPGEVATKNSLAEAVRAEEKKMALLAPAPAAKDEAPKAMVVKAEAPQATVAKEDGAKTVMVKQDGTRTVVETREGTVLKIKGKE